MWCVHALEYGHCFQGQKLILVVSKLGMLLSPPLPPPHHHGNDRSAVKQEEKGRGRGQGHKDCRNCSGAMSMAAARQLTAGEQGLLG